MKDPETQRQLLLRYLDGQLKPAEEEQVVELLRIDVEAREFLRDVAEQAVVVADLERASERRRDESEKFTKLAGDGKIARADGTRSRPSNWQWVLAAAACIAAVATAVAFWPRDNSETVVNPQTVKEIAKITGLSGSVM